MKAYLLGAWIVLALLTACGQRQPPAEAPTTPTPAPVAPPVAAPAPVAQPAAPERPFHFRATQLYGVFAAAADTLLRLPGRSYRISWQVRLDTLQPLTHVTPPNPARYFAGDTSRGFQGYYRVEIRDSLGQRVGRHAFTKAAFYPAVGPELAISSEVSLPHLLGYSEPLGGLVFTVPFNAPGTDWYGEAVLVLGLSGQVRYLGVGAGSDGPQVTAALSADGRTLLTEKAIRRAGQPPLPLARAGAELRGARLLNDTLALLVYERGRTRTDSTGTPYLEATPAQRRLPNAFVLNTHTGKTVGQFRYGGFYYEIGYVIPGKYLPATGTLYLLDDQKGLYALAAAQPAHITYWPLKALPASAGPKRATEVEVQLNGPTREFLFLVDTLAPTHIRYRRP